MMRLGGGGGMLKALSGDELLGRDTGSEGYRKAAAYVVAQLGRAGVQAAGENGWYQSVPLRVVRFRADQSEIALAGANGVTKLRWLHQVSVTARANLPESVDAAMVFDGAAGGEEIDYKGKILVRLGVATGTGGGRRGGGTGAGGDSGDADHRRLGRAGAAAVAGGVLGGNDAGGGSGGGACWRRRIGAALQSFGGGRFVRGVGTHV